VGRSEELLAVEKKKEKEKEKEEETLEVSSGHKACEVKPLIFLCNFHYTCRKGSYKL
jgi:hypothetical protein